MNLKVGGRPSSPAGERSGVCPRGGRPPGPHAGQAARQLPADKSNQPFDLISMECPEKQFCSQSRKRIVSMVSPDEGKNNPVDLDFNPVLGDTFL